jgi:HK97 family phage major capsid protein
VQRNALLRAARRAFGSEDAAVTAGMWLGAVVLRNADAEAWCRENHVPLQRAQGENVNSAGGALVPSEIEAAIIKLRDVVGVFRRYAAPVTMIADTKTQPRLTGGLTAYFVGESAALTESSRVWDSIAFVAKKCAVFTKASSELIEDAAAAFADEFTVDASYALASKEDDSGFNGTGAQSYGGIRGATVLINDGSHGGSMVTAGASTFATLTATDLASLIGTLPSYALPGACWFMHPRAIGLTAARLGLSVGLEIADSGAPSLNLLGFPLIPTPSLPSSTGSLSGQLMLMFGDLSLAGTIASRRGITVFTSVHRFAELDQVAMTTTERFDIKLHDLGDGSSPGPLLALFGA